MNRDRIEFTDQIVTFFLILQALMSFALLHNHELVFVWGGLFWAIKAGQWLIAKLRWRKKIPAIQPQLKGFPSTEYINFKTHSGSDFAERSRGEYRLILVPQNYRSLQAHSPERLDNAVIHEIGHIEAGDNATLSSYVLCMFTVSLIFVPYFFGLTLDGFSAATSVSLEFSDIPYLADIPFFVLFLWIYSYIVLPVLQIPPPSRISS